MINKTFITLALTLLVAWSSAGCSRQADTGGSGAKADELAEAAAAEHTQTPDLPDVLTRPLRLAFMSGHVEAGIALYRAGEPTMAAPHLLHPVSETHAAERAGLDELGFDPTVFEAVSSALDAGITADEVDSQLVKAQQNLADMASRAGGEPVEVIAFLLDTIDKEYAIGVVDGVVTDPGEYQDAYGFTRVAIATAAQLPTELRDAVLPELEALLQLWPSAPVPPENPTPSPLVAQQVAGARFALGIPIE